MPKHEAHQKLADYIEEYTGKLLHQGESIESFAELWKAFSGVKAGSWGKKMREDMKYLFDKHVLPDLGQYSPRNSSMSAGVSQDKTGKPERLAPGFALDCYRFAKRARRQGYRRYRLSRIPSGGSR